MKKFTVLSCFNLSLFLFCLSLPLQVDAEPLLQEADVFASGNYFDKTHEEEEEGSKAERVESRYDIGEDPPYVKSWCYANAWIGDIHGSVRVFNYKGLRFRNIREGTAFDADIKFKVGLYGLINSVTFANAASNYKAKITAGIMEYDSIDYDSPLAGTVLWAKTNKRELKDWGNELLWIHLLPRMRKSCTPGHLRS